MEGAIATALAFLQSPAGQAIAGAAVSMVLKVANGTDMATAQAEFAASASEYAQAIKDWQDAKAANPAPDAAPPAAPAP